MLPETMAVLRLLCPFIELSCSTSPGHRIHLSTHELFTHASAYYIVTQVLCSEEIQKLIKQLHLLFLGRLEQTTLYSEWGINDGPSPA